MLTGEQIQLQEDNEYQTLSQDLYLRNYLTDSYLVVDEEGDCVVVT